MTPTCTRWCNAGEALGDVLRALAIYFQLPNPGC